jgi:hypothetical protein
MLTRDTWLVLIAPEKKVHYLTEHYGSSVNVVVEGVDTALTWRDRLLQDLALAASKTTTVRLKELSGQGGRLGLLRPLLRFQVARRLLRVVDYLLTPRRWDQYWGTLISYPPDLVLLTDIFHPMDVALLHLARANGIRTVGMVRSWDNTTSKGYLRAVPDQVVTPNDLVLGELARLHDLG